MALPLEVLARTVDEHVDAAEILQSADIDADARIARRHLGRHAGNQVENVGRAVRLNLRFDPIAADDARGRQGIVDALAGLGRRDRDGIEIDGRLITGILSLGRRCENHQAGGSEGHSEAAETKRGHGLDDLEQERETGERTGGVAGLRSVEHQRMK